MILYRNLYYYIWGIIDEIYNKLGFPMYEISNQFLKEINDKIVFYLLTVFFKNFFYYK